MRFETPLLKAKFLDRPNRFLGVVKIGNQKVQCFIPNPGRMKELLYTGAEVFLRKENAPHRKTRFDLVVVNHDGSLVSVDSRVPNKLLHEAITRGELLEFKGFQVLKNEPRFHDSRFDLLLKDDETQIMVEAKSCTLVKGKVAQFPDAPTKRGSRHVQTLIEALEYGRAAVVFVIQRNDVAEFQPYHQNDPVFANSLIQAAEKGVEVYAYRCRVDLTSINIFDRIPAYIKPE